MMKKHPSQLSKSNVVIKGASDKAIHSALGRGRRRFLLVVILLIVTAILGYGGYQLRKNNKLGLFSKDKGSSSKGSSKNQQTVPQIKIYPVPPKDAPAPPPKPAKTG